MPHNKPAPDKTAMSFGLTKEDAARLRELAASRGVPISEIIRQAIAEELKRFELRSQNNQKPNN